MSVLIKGMTMPKKCGDCPCMDLDQSCCGITFDDVSSLQISMQGNCPLMEVPPHGRLIDADALLDLLKYCMFPSDMVTTTAVRMAMNWIKDSPTVIEAEPPKEES